MRWYIVCGETTTSGAHISNIEAGWAENGWEIIATTPLTNSLVAVWKLRSLVRMRVKLDVESSDFCF